MGCTCVGAITIYIEAGQLAQPLFATFATVPSLHTLSFFNMQQPHQCLLALVVITIKSTGRYESYSVGLQETFTQNLTVSRRVCYRLEQYFYISYQHKLSSKHSVRLS